MRRSEEGYPNYHTPLQSPLQSKMEMSKTCPLASFRFAPIPEQDVISLDNTSSSFSSLQNFWMRNEDETDRATLKEDVSNCTAICTTHCMGVTVRKKSILRRSAKFSDGVKKRMSINKIDLSKVDKSACTTKQIGVKSNIPRLVKGNYRTHRETRKSRVLMNNNIEGSSTGITRIPVRKVRKSLFKKTYSNPVSASGRNKFLLPQGRRYSAFVVVSKKPFLLRRRSSMLREEALKKARAEVEVAVRKAATNNNPNNPRCPA